MASWQVTEQAIAAMNNMAAQLQELATKIHQETEQLKATFDENQDGLGAHSASIQALIDDVEGTEQDASVPVKKLVLKLQRAVLIRQKHIENNLYGSTASGGIITSTAAGFVAVAGTAVGTTNNGSATNDSKSNGNARAALGEKFVKGLNDTLSKSTHSDVKSVYQKHGNQLTVKDSNHSGGAFYRHGEGVYMNAEQVSKGDMIHTPYQTAFHEFGHNIDYIMGDGSPISESWGNNALYDAIKQDFGTLKGSSTNEELVEKLRGEMGKNGWTIADTASVSDIIESMTGISYPLGVGHGKDYWAGRMPNKEFFAETLDGAAANEKSYGLLRQMFPHAVSIVHRIIGGK